VWHSLLESRALGLHADTILLRNHSKQCPSLDDFSKKTQSTPPKANLIKSAPNAYERKSSDKCAFFAKARRRHKFAKRSLLICESNAAAIFGKKSLWRKSMGMSSGGGRCLHDEVMSLSGKLKSER
jgi:hypothetical protein